jgi:TRAP-type C4-dicarboxylate transport system substrate-binding protein
VRGRRAAGVLLAGLLVTTGAACAAEPPPPPDAEPRAVAFVHDIPGTHPRIPYLEAFARDIGAASERTLAVRINTQGETLAGRASLDAVRSGAAHIAAVNMAHLEALEPQAGFMNLPFGLNDTTMADASNRAAVTEILAAALRPHGVELLGIMRGADQLFAFPRDDVHVLEDLAGRRIRVAGGGIYEQVLRDLGAEPVAIPIPQIRDAMSRGEVDGVFTSPGGWTSEVRGDAPHAVQVPGLMLITYGVVADAAWLASLTAAERDAVVTAGSVVTAGWAAMQRDDEMVVAAATADGSTYRVLSEAETVRWADAVADVRAGFLAGQPALAERLRRDGLVGGP